MRTWLLSYVCLYPYIFQQGKQIDCPCDPACAIHHSITNSCLLWIWSAYVAVGTTTCNGHSSRKAVVAALWDLAGETHVNHNYVSSTVWKILVTLKEIAVNLIHTNRRRSFPVLYAVKLFLVREIRSNLRSSSFFIASVVVYLSTRHSRQRHNKKKKSEYFPWLGNEEWTSVGLRLTNIITFVTNIYFPSY